MSKHENETSNAPVSKAGKLRLELAIICVVMASFVAATGLAYVLAANQIGYWQVWERPGAITGQQWFEHIRNAATLVGVPAVGSALVFSYFRQRSTDRSIVVTERQLGITGDQLELARRQAEQASLSEARQHLHELRERFSGAMTALAESDEVRRSGGIRMTIAVANDFQALKDDAGRQDCIDALLVLLEKLDADGQVPQARRLWKKITNRMDPLNSDSANWWNADLELIGIKNSFGPMYKWVLTGGHKDLSALAISSGSTAVVQNTCLDGGRLSIRMGSEDLPIRMIQNELNAGTLTIDFAASNNSQLVSFEDCSFSQIRLVILEQMFPARPRALKFFRCTFTGASFDLPDDLRRYSLEFSQCQFHDVPLLSPLPESDQPSLDLWDRNKFVGKAEGYLENPEDASDFDRWSRKVSPYL